MTLGSCTPIPRRSPITPSIEFRTWRRVRSSWKKQFNAWMGYYERERVEAIGFGLITMRRSNRASNWFRYESWPEMIGACGEAIEQRLCCRDFLEAHSDDRKLLKRAYGARQTCAGVRIRKCRLLAPPVIPVCSLTSGLAYTANADARSRRVCQSLHG